MSIFGQQMNTQAYLKCGIMGFAGDGKTFTATSIAIGLVEYMQSLGVEKGGFPAMFLDTETGSDWVAPRFAEAGIELHTAKTRAFKDLIPAINEAEANGSVLIIDSISHFWRELTESYADRKNRQYGLQFQDWAWLKQEWGKFTDVFVNSNCHIIMCGRAGYEYDFFERDDGKKELEKTGIKMKAETETGYEPSILLYMQKHTDMESKVTYRTATVFKDRANVIDGQVFRNPTFEHFLPHIQFLNIGGQQMGVDTTRNSKDMITKTGKSEWQVEREEKEIVLDEIQAVMVKHYPSTSKDDKLAKMALIEKHFKSKSWKRIETFPLAMLKNGYDALHLELEGIPAYGDPAQMEKDKAMTEEDIDDIPATSKEKTEEAA